MPARTSKLAQSGVRRRQKRRRRWWCQALSLQAFQDLAGACAVGVGPFLYTYRESGLKAGALAAAAVRAIIWDCENAAHLHLHAAFVPASNFLCSGDRISDRTRKRIENTRATTMHWLAHMVRFALERWGYLALAAGLLGEDAGVPVPGETVLMFSSFISHKS